MDHLVFYIIVIVVAIVILIIGYLAYKKRYKDGVILVLVSLLSGFGMVLTIQKYVKYRNEAYYLGVEKDLIRLKTMEDDYYTKNGSYSDKLDELGFKPKEDAIITVLEATDNCFIAKGVSKSARLSGYMIIDCKGNKLLQP